MKKTTIYFLIFTMLCVAALSCSKDNSQTTRKQLLGIWDNQANMNTSISFNNDGTGNVNNPPNFSATFMWSLEGDTTIVINYTSYPPDRWRITNISGTSLVANEEDSTLQEYYTRP